MTTIKQRAEAAGLNLATVYKRRQRGWPEQDQFVSPVDLRNKCAHKPKKAHPWRRENAADTHTARLSSLNYRKRGAK